MIENKKYFDFITLLKFVAILLITNSHSKWMYPESLSSLGSGGAWGCAIFFFCSGFTMANMKTDCFWKYLLKRLVRIYPVIWLWYLATLPIQENFSWSYILWPNYWFIQAILTFYVLFYFCMKYLKKYTIMVILGCLATTLLIYMHAKHSSWMIDLTYQKDKITWFYYFGIMLLGAFLRQKSEYIQIIEAPKTLPRLLILPVSFAICYGIKFSCIKGVAPINMQLLFPLMLFLSCFLFYTCLWPISLKKKAVTTSIVTFISKRTLEIYITQQLILDICQPYGRPFGAIAAIFSILLLSTLFHWLTSWSIRKLNIAKLYSYKQN